MSHQDLNRADISVLHSRLSSIKVRCPECFKLYLVKTEDIREPRPRFECLSCQTQFWIPFDENWAAEEILGFPLEWMQEESSQGHSTQDGLESGLDGRVQSATPEVSAEPSREDLTPQGGEHRKASDISLKLEPEFHCPKCERPYRAGDKECLGCGLIFTKFDWLKDQDSFQLSASPELKFLWREVIEDFVNESLHRKFLAACQKEENLPFAAAQYGRILEVQPEEPMAQSMTRALVALTAAPLSREKSFVGSSQTVASGRSAVRTLPWPRFSSWIIFLSSMLIVMGYFLPAFRNMVGVGAALIFLSLALRFYFPRL